MLRGLVEKYGPGEWDDKVARMRRVFGHGRSPKGLESQYYKICFGANGVSSSHRNHGGAIRNGCPNSAWAGLHDMILQIDPLSRSEVDLQRLPTPLPIVKLGDEHGQSGVPIACLVAARSGDLVGASPLPHAVSQQRVPKELL